MVITELESLDFANKSFVFDTTISFFKCGDKWVSREKYEELGLPHYFGYLSEYDEENPIVAKVIEAGGVVRQSISGKTNFFVVGKSLNGSSAKYRDYNKQLEKGKPIVAITVDNLRKLLGINENSDAESQNKDEHTDKYGIIEYFDQRSSEIPVAHPDNIIVDEIGITGGDCANWVYTVADNKQIIYLTDYIGDAESITLPSTIDGKKVELTWLSAPGGCRFEKCKAKKVFIPGSYEEIPSAFFLNNECLEEIVIGYGIKKIGFNFCGGAEKLKTAHFPDSISEVEFGCLDGTRWMKEQGDEAIAGTILIHKTGTKYRWSNESVYYVPEGVTCIAQYAFYSEEEDKRTYYIHRVELPSSMKYISTLAFFMLPINTIRMPSSIEYIGKKAFRGTRIENFYRDKKHESMLIINNILNEVFVDNCSEVLYVPDGVKMISDEAMQGLENRPDHVVLPDSIESLGELIQWGGIKQIEISSNLKTIGWKCFYGCEELTNIELPASLETINDHAFSASGLVSITIPGSVKTITQFLFGKCKHLEKVVINEGVETILDSAFEECSSLKSVSLPNSLKNIGYRAFAMCESLKSIKIPSSVEVIDEEAFIGCYELEIVAEGEIITGIVLGKKEEESGDTCNNGKKEDDKKLPRLHKKAIKPFKSGAVNNRTRSKLIRSSAGKSKTLRNYIKGRVSRANKIVLRGNIYNGQQ